MSESLPANDPGAQKRRSTRVVQAVPITVSGVDALGQPFKERTTTVSVNCHGCEYQSKHYVPKNSTVTLEIPRIEPDSPPRIVPGHVMWVQRPQTVRELFKMGLEFETSGNVWGIAFPPEDWFACDDEAAPAIPARSDAAAPATETTLSEISEDAVNSWEEQTAVPETIPASPAAKAPVPPPPQSTAPVPSSVASVTPATPKPLAPSGTAPAAVVGESKVHVMPSPAASSPAPSQDAQLAVARQMAKIVAEAKETLDKTLRRGAQTAINEEMAMVRQQLDAQMHETIEHAIKASMERVSEAEVKKIVQQVANKTAAIVEEARVASEANAQKIDEKVRQAVHEAVSQAVEQATKDAAQQAASQNLRQGVEEVVGRVIAERMSLLGVLASPEAAQQHLEDWKKNLEQAAQEARGRTMEQSQAEAEAASRRWREEWEAILAGSSATIGGKLNEASQGAMADAEQEFAARKEALRALLDQAISGAEASIQSLGAGLEHERARAEQAKAQLEEIARATVEQTRQRIDAMAAARQEAIVRQAGEVIEDGIRQMEPALRNSAENLVERFSGDFDRELAPKLEEARKVVAELTNAEKQAAQLQNAALDRLRQAADAAVEKAVAELAFAGGEAARLQDGIREQTQRVWELADQVGGAAIEKVRIASAEVAQNTISGLANAERQGTEIEGRARERMQQAADQMAQQNAERMQQDAAKHLAEFEQARRDRMAGLEEELDRKSAEMQHSAYEALLKSSEWYQKKAQMAMQSTMERVIEQSAETMRDKAGEVSSTVASELDHYRRSYVEHGRGEIEEIAREVVERERGRLSEAAEIANATFTDRAGQVASESLRRFQEASRDALEKARSDMEFNREDSLAEFQKRVDEKMTQGVEQAGTYLQSQLIPLLESWEAKRKAEKQEWMEQIKKSSEQSLDAYRARLENATNAWLLTSAATLGQNSQAVLDNLSKAAEKRIRDTCSQVLAGMGDMLKERLLEISSAFTEKDEREQK